MITVEGLGFSYGEKPVLEDVSLCAEGGTFTAVIGPKMCIRDRFNYENGTAAERLFLKLLFPAPAGQA